MSGSSFLGKASSEQEKRVDYNEHWCYNWTEKRKEKEEKKRKEKSVT